MPTSITKGPSVLPQTAYRRLLLDERRLRHERRSIVDELGADDDTSSELPAEAPDEDDDASLLIERERDEGLIEEIDAALAAIDAARLRLADGTYGLCERCGEPIGEERLEILPATPVCVEHAQGD